MLELFLPNQLLLLKNRPEQMPSTSPLPDVPKAPPAVLHWRHWPVRDEFSTHGPLLILAVVMAIITGNAIHNGWLTAIVVLTWVAVSWQMFVTTEYELNGSGLTQVTAGRMRSIPWRNIRRYRVVAKGVFIYLRTKETPLDGLRSIFLPFGNHRVEALFAFHHYLGESTRA